MTGMRSSRIARSSGRSSIPRRVSAEIVYVGDRLDNDLRPAKEAGHADGVHPARPVGLHLGTAPGHARRGGLADDHPC